MSDHAENSDVLELFGSGANAIDLDAIRARWEAATPGPWEIQGVPDWCYVGRVGEDDRYVAKLGARLDEPDAVAIAHAPTDIAALLAEVERLETIVEPMTERLLAALREKPRTTFAAALDEWRRSASPEVPSDLDTALRAWEAAEAEVARLTEGIRAGIAHREEISQEGESR